MGMLFILLLSSCFKEDVIVPMPEQGDIQTGVIALGQYYSQQVFYDLSGNSIISSNTITDWDIAFECEEDQWHITLNAAKMMYAGNSRDTTFANISSADGLDMLFDKSDGDMDSTAIGKWYYFENNVAKSHRYVYVLDLGTDGSATNIGMKKITLDIVEGNYNLKYANLDGSNLKNTVISKDPTFRHMYFSFKDDAVVNIAPAKDLWSLKFSKYATMLESNRQDYPYLVTGALLNPELVSVAIDTGDFFEFSIHDTIKHLFSKEKDFIGYDWKYYSFDDEMYSIVPYKNYIIKNHDGFFYKLRFISFYDEFGTKGSITIETVRL